ncbi:hypothetical protein Goarm_010239, partial [Gossypium armourianum]|nr:hypothetical protein [Gossypium armourianum]
RSWFFPGFLLFLSFIYTGFCFCKKKKIQVEVPKVEPKFKAPFLGFTRTAEIWNSRACMIGIIGVFIVELIINKGILQTIGVDVGKGLDIPL